MGWGDACLVGLLTSKKGPMERGSAGGDLCAKKDGTNVKAVRAGRPVTQTTPGLEGYLSPPQPE